MRTVNRRTRRDQLMQLQDNGDLPDGVGGTVTGGPMEPIDLMEILARGGRGNSRGGAVSGAAQVMVSSPDENREPNDRAIALSDGSRITFASVAGAGVPEADRVRFPGGDTARVVANGKTRVLTAV